MPGVKFLPQLVLHGGLLSLLEHLQVLTPGQEGSVKPVYNIFCSCYQMGRRVLLRLLFTVKTRF